MKIEELSSRRLLILGLGKEGQAIIRFMRHLWPSKEILVADKVEAHLLPAVTKEFLAEVGPLRSFFGANYLDALAECEVIFKAPGIPLRDPLIQRALKSGAVILDSLAGLFFANTIGTIIGVTGTKGKSTTTALIHHILKSAGLDAHLVGNIGNTPLQLLESDHPKRIYVYELSSFQLEMLNSSPQIAVVLHIVPEHLDSHGSYEAYLAAKGRITQFQSASDLVVYNADSKSSSQLVELSKARRIACALDAETPLAPATDFATVENGSVVISSQTQPRARALASLRSSSLIGKFNWNNIVPAVVVADSFGVSTEVIEQALGTFAPLPHRLEPLGEFRGIRFVNASLATEPEATSAHIEALAPDVDTLIVGGTDRGVSYRELARRLQTSGIRNLVLLPTTGEKIWKNIQEEFPNTSMKAFSASSMEEAVRLSFQCTAGGKICLLSPASASFTLFRDYRERGDLFRKYVEELGGPSARDRVPSKTD